MALFDSLIFKMAKEGCCLILRLPAVPVD